jgi:hypothetical protein
MSEPTEAPQHPHGDLDTVDVDKGLKQAVADGPIDGNGGAEDTRAGDGGSERVSDAPGRTASQKPDTGDAPDATAAFKGSE